MTIDKILHEGQLYDGKSQQIKTAQMKSTEALTQYNATYDYQTVLRQQLLRKMFKQVGLDCCIQPPLHATWGGKHVLLGDNVYAHFNLTLLDDTYIEICDNTIIGPNVTLATSTHPLSPALRAQHYQYNAPIKIGKNCWLGAGVIVNPGVTIGDNTVIGSGSIVTKDIPENVVAVGAPCKVLREIDQREFLEVQGWVQVD